MARLDNIDRGMCVGWRKIYKACILCILILHNVKYQPSNLILSLSCQGQARSIQQSKDVQATKGGEVPIVQIKSLVAAPHISQNRLFAPHLIGSHSCGTQGQKLRHHENPLASPLTSNCTHSSQPRKTRPSSLPQKWNLTLTSGFVHLSAWQDLSKWMNNSKFRPFRISHVSHSLMDGEDRASRDLDEAGCE
jgi:hypothetical protein